MAITRKEWNSVFDALPVQTPKPVEWSKTFPEGQSAKITRTPDELEQPTKEDSANAQIFYLIVNFSESNDLEFEYSDDSLPDGFFDLEEKPEFETINSYEKLLEFLAKTDPTLETLLNYIGYSQSDWSD